MKLTFLSLIFAHLTILSIGQTVISESKSVMISKNILDKSVKQLLINTSNYNKKILEDIKDEFDGWKEKIISLEINEKNQQLILIHNELMEPRELFEILNKYAIKKEDIISYK